MSLVALVEVDVVSHTAIADVIQGLFGRVQRISCLFNHILDGRCSLDVLRGCPQQDCPMANPVDVSVRSIEARAHA